MAVCRDVKGHRLAEVDFDEWAPGAPIAVMLSPVGCASAYENFTVKEAKKFVKEIRAAILEAEWRSK
jgi:hypothetical protein